MRQGKVLFFLNLKGYGFVQDLSTKKEYYFHYKVIESKESFKKLERGDYVDYEIGDGENPDVTSIKKIERIVDGKPVCRAGIIFYQGKADILDVIKVISAPGLKYVIPSDGAILVSEYDISEDAKEYMKQFMEKEDSLPVINTDLKYDLIITRLKGEKFWYKM